MAMYDDPELISSPERFKSIAIYTTISSGKNRKLMEQPLHIGQMSEENHMKAGRKG